MTLGSRFLDPNKEASFILQKNEIEQKKGEQTKGKNIKLKNKEPDIDKDAMNDRSRCC